MNFRKKFLQQHKREKSYLLESFLEPLFERELFSTLEFMRISFRFDLLPQLLII